MIIINNKVYAFNDFYVYDSMIMVLPKDLQFHLGLV
jgi:hypothetical protein